MQNSQQTAERIKLLAKTNKIPISKLTLDCDLNKNALYTMQSKEFYPRVETIVKIADYLNCSIDYLLGRSDIVENNRLSKDEQDMINRFRQLTPGGQEYILNTLDMALTKYQKGRPFEKEEEYSVAAYGAAETEDTQPPVPEINTLP